MYVRIYTYIVYTIIRIYKESEREREREEGVGHF